MSVLKKRAFYRLGQVAAAIDRNRDDLVLTTRDAITQLGDDLQPEIVAAFESYCSAANGLRGVGLALSRNEAAIDDIEQQHTGAGTDSSQDAK
tara:strand:+ start:8284 stop:8562 length:279 start_codon:yes stop_codon:yes gene_type:complete